TLVDGHPLAFHGDPKKMFRGYLLVGAMVVVYSVAGQFSPTAGLIAFLILILVWPALLKSSMQFRLANTSWRGLRFRFTGSVRGAYEAMLPLFVPGAIFLAMASVVDPEQKQAPPDWFWAAILAVFVLMLLTPPWLWWKFKKYQHDHYAYAGLQTQFKATAGSFFGVFLKTVGISLMSALLVGVVVAAVVAVLGLMDGGFSALGQSKSVFFSLGLLLPPLMLLAVYVVGIPYFTSRMQNLVWSKTGNREFRFQSNLTFRSALKLTVKNWLLIGLTLGLYWPFAAVAMARLKLQAMAVLTRVDPQALINRSKTHEGEAAGDAAGDLFGVDIGL
ncbi:MAG: YjgN family protein, partial [Burkholderiaceae bacterium]